MITNWVTESEYFQNLSELKGCYEKKKRTKILKNECKFLHLDSKTASTAMQNWGDLTWKSFRWIRFKKSSTRTCPVKYFYPFQFLCLWEFMNYFVIKCCVWREAVETNRPCKIGHIQKVPFWTELCWNYLIIHLY